MLDLNNYDIRLKSLPSKTTFSLSSSCSKDLHSLQLSWNSRYSSLIYRARSEILWFIENQFEESIHNQHCGMDNLTIKLQQIYYNQLRSSWCPYILRSLDNRRQELFDHIIELGIPSPPKYEYDIYKLNYLIKKQSESILQNKLILELNEMKMKYFSSFESIICDTAGAYVEMCLSKLRYYYGCEVLQPFINLIQTISTNQQEIQLQNCLHPNHSVQNYLLSLCTLVEKESSNLLERLVFFFILSSLLYIV